MSIGPTTGVKYIQPCSQPILNVRTSSDAGRGRITEGTEIVL